MPTKILKDAHLDAARRLGSTIRRVEEDFKSLFPFIKDLSSQPIKESAAVQKPSVSNVSPAAAPSRTSPEAIKQTPAPEKKSLEQAAGSPEVMFENQSEQAQAELFLNDLKSTSSSIRLQALRELKKLSKPVVVRILEQLLPQENDSLKVIEILNTLSNLVEGMVVPRELFKNYLSHPDEGVRLAALRAIAKYRDEESFDILINHAKDKSAEVRRQVLNCLCWNFEERCLPNAVSALHDVDPGVQKTACKIIGVFKGPEGISGLITLLSDPQEEVQEGASTALKKITDQNFGFRAAASNKSKQTAIDEWRLWWRENQIKFGHSKNNGKIQ